MARLRVSAISFLNTAPLMWDFEHGEGALRERLGREFEISYTIPSLCAEAMRQGEAELGIIPAFAYHGIPGLKILPGVAIAARGAVQSILLVSRRPIAEVRTVAVDTASRSSVALLRVLFAKWLGGARELTPCEPDLEKMLAQADAALLIGDPALTTARAGLHVYDLAEEWTRRTAKPFVFAFWAVRAAAERPGLAAVFQHSRDQGLKPQNVERIARGWAPRVGLSPEAVRDYLTRSIHYELDAECLAGMELFFAYAQETGVLAQRRALEFALP